MHGTNYSLVQNNVAFDSYGHCYYLEDGVEEFNTIDGNLAALIRVMGTVRDCQSRGGGGRTDEGRCSECEPDRMPWTWAHCTQRAVACCPRGNGTAPAEPAAKPPAPCAPDPQPAAGVDQSGVTVSTTSTGLENPSDTAAAGYYVTDPNNWVTNNAASGGYSGFFYPILPSPINMHKGVNFSPYQRPLLSFTNNSAHSSGESGVRWRLWLPARRAGIRGVCTAPTQPRTRSPNPTPRPGYYWENAGCVYFGGKLYYDNNILTYYSGRVAFDTKCALGRRSGNEGGGGGRAEPRRLVVLSVRRGVVPARSCAWCEASCDGVRPFPSHPRRALCPLSQDCGRHG